MRKTFAVQVLKRGLVLVLLVLLLTTCSRNDDGTEPKNSVCGVKDPLSELPWLKNLISSTTAPNILYEGARIYSYGFKGAVVFYISNPASTVSSRNVYNCTGQVMISASAPDADWEDFKLKRDTEKLLWSKPICGVTDMNDLPWLKTIISDNSSSQKPNAGARIYSYVFKGATVFYLWNPGLHLATRTVYGCSGNVLISSSSSLDDWDEFRNNKTQEILQWSKPLCAAEDPLNDLPWMKTMINNPGTTYPPLHEMAVIYAYVFRGNNVFYVWNPFAASGSKKLYNCNGDLILNIQSPEADWIAFESEKTFENLLWGKGFCANRVPVKDLDWLQNIISNNNPFQLRSGARVYSYIVKTNSSALVSLPWICIWNPGAASPETVYDCSGKLLTGSSAPRQQWDEFRRSRALETLLLSKE